MAKETVRYPDALVARIEAFVEDSSAFESKSEYHRFASEYLLSLVDPDHQPSVLGYGEIFDDLGRELDEAFETASADEEPFLETYIRVRRHLLHGEVDAARAVVDEAYDVTDREALLLDELIGRSRREEGPPSGGHRGQAAGNAEATGASNGRVGEREAEPSSESDAGPIEQGMDARSTDETTVESEY